VVETFKKGLFVNSIGVNMVEFGNYIYAGIIFGIFIISANIVKLIIHRYVRKLVDRSKSKLDNVILTSLEKPLFYFLILAGVYFSWSILIINGRVNEIFNNILSIFFIINFFYFFIRFVDCMLADYMKPFAEKTKTELDDQLLPVIRKIVKITLVVIAIIIILEKFGYNISGLVAGLGIGGLAFAFAAKDLLGNLFGGISIFTDKPFKVGQTVKVMGYSGKVKAIGLRSTRILTFDGTHLIIPNSKINEDVVENISMEKTRKVKLNLNVNFNTSNSKIKKAKEVIKKIIKENEHTKDDSKVYFSGFKESSLNLLVIYYIENIKKLLVAKDEVNLAIKEAFEKNKISFAYPTQTLYVKK